VRYFFFLSNGSSLLLVFTQRNYQLLVHLDLPIPVPYSNPMQPPGHPAIITVTTYHHHRHRHHQYFDTSRRPWYCADNRNNITFSYYHCWMMRSSCRLVLLCACAEHRRSTMKTQSQLLHWLLERHRDITLLQYRRDADARLLRCSGSLCVYRMDTC
jgi:hypothetical protein